MTTYTQKASGVNVALYDTLNPFAQLPTGAGAPAHLLRVEDQVAIPAVGFLTAGNFVRLCRFPSHACIKAVNLFSDKSLVDGGTSSSALVLSVGVVFSDSTVDGTPVTYQNQMPTTVGIGGGSTTPGTVVAIGGTNANYIFGTITALGSTGSFSGGTVAGPSTGSGTLYGGDITFGGAIATYGEPLVLTQTPLVNLFNFRDGAGLLLPKLGMMDLIVVATTGYNTVPSAAYNLYATVTYTI